jgi:hypothetical protein
VNALLPGALVGDGLTPVLAQLVAPAMVVAWSPVRVLPALAVVVQAKRPRAAVVAFAVGSVTGLAAVTASALSVPRLAHGLPTASPTAMPWCALIAGVALVAFALYAWRRRARGARLAPWATRAAVITPTTAAVLGVVLSVTNVKVLVANAAAGAIIDSAALTAGGTTMALTGYIAVAASTVTVPTVAYLCAGARVERVLALLRHRIERHTAVVVTAGSAVVGAMLILGGLLGLLTR